MRHPDPGTDEIVVARAPGRVNLIGEHTDYTGGLVLPCAIDRWTVVRGRRGGDEVRVQSHGFAGEARVALGAAAGGGATRGATGAAVPAAARWTAFVRAAVAVVAERGPVVGFAGRARSTVPTGGGLSSSTSFATALTLALAPDLASALAPDLALAADVALAPDLASALAPDAAPDAAPRSAAALPVGAGIGAEAGTDAARALAAVVRRIEHLATGTPTGIMDQLVIAAARAGHALLLDCTTLEVRHVALPDARDAVLMVVDSGVRHDLAATAYAVRVEECRRAAEVLGPLRDARPADVVALRDPVLRARARHVVGENERVRAAVDLLAAGDVAGLGAVLVDGHRSLRDDYEVSVPEVDELVDRLVQLPGVLGARLTGGGFGGCVVALCRPDAVAAVQRLGGPSARVVRAVDAADVVVRRR